MSKTRVRFAPSPTGYLHIGSARTALFNWLFARHEGGEFILRIEDTDKTRSNQEFLDEILESLRWLGMNWDGDITHQSQRMEIYNKYAKELLDKGLAYEDEGAIHFKMPQTKLKVSDVLHKEIVFDTSLIKDQVLIKSDKTPTYNFACVVDDADMGITHIIRGDDHISNTPKQVVIYNALGKKLPVFCHIPLILGVDRSRMSKRHGATSIRDYKGEGYLPEALVNYLCNLGWSMGDDKEIFSMADAKRAFTLDKITRTAAVFDINKLTWMNSQYIKQLNTEKLLDMSIDVLKKANLYKEEFDRNWLLGIVKLFQERVHKINDFTDLTDFFFKDDFAYDEEGLKKHFKPEAKPILEKAIDRLQGLEDFEIEALDKTIRALAEEMGLKAAKIIHPIRLATTGKTKGAGLFETIALLGKAKTIERLKIAIAKFF